MKPDIEATKNQLADALIHVMKTKTFANITVEDICRECRYSKRTFYNYFLDKNDLVAYIWSKISYESWHTEDGELCSYGQYLKNFELYSQQVFPFFERSFEYTGQNSLRDIIFETTFEQILDVIKQNGYEEEINNEIIQIIRYFVHGAVGYAEEMITYFQKTKDREALSSQFFTDDRAVDFMPERIKPLLLTKKE